MPRKKQNRTRSKNGAVACAYFTGSHTRLPFFAAVA